MPMRPLPIVLAWGLVMAVIAGLIVRELNATGVASLLNIGVLLLALLATSIIDRERFYGPRGPRHHH